MLVLLAALLPLPALAVNPFTDLDPAQATGHNPNIDAIFNAGITRGCNPPANDNYCPKDVVTREQMASFLARTAGLGANPPVANAATAVSATNATNATNAAELGGVPAASYLQSGASVNVASLVTGGSASVGGDFQVAGQGSLGGGLQLGGTLQVARIETPQFRAQRLIGTIGPLMPLTGATFTTGGGPLLVFASGSGYSTASGKLIGMDLAIDGVLVGTSEVYTNEAGSHKAFVPIQEVVTGIPGGTHTLTLTPKTLGTYNTTTNPDDRFLVTVIELPFVTAP